MQYPVVDLEEFLGTTPLKPLKILVEDALILKYLEGSTIEMLKKAGNNFFLLFNFKAKLFVKNRNLLLKILDPPLISYAQISKTCAK